MKNPALPTYPPIYWSVVTVVTILTEVTVVTVVTLVTEVTVGTVVTVVNSDKSHAISPHKKIKQPFFF